MTGKQIIIQGGMHGREWVTSVLVTKMAEQYLSSGEDFGIYFLPMTNPDGVTLAQIGSSAFPNKRVALEQINGGNNFEMWKANLRGVDINCNFDAKWGKGSGNTNKPAPQSCAGASPESENETKALTAFTLKIKPVLTISYHAKGGEVYYEFGQKNTLDRDRAIAMYVSRFLEYSMIDGDLGSAGGYKDWCITRLGIPALTIEIIDDSHEHPLTENDLYGEEKNLWIPNFLAKMMKSL